jgi:protein-disulfide isomerase
MIVMFRLIAAAPALLLLLLLLVASVHAQSGRADIEAIVKDYLVAHPEEVERIVKNYLINDPDVLKDALAELIKRQVTGTSADKSAAIKSHAGLLFDSPRQVTLGNPKGDVTVVEFFDYNCGFCKRALADMMELLKDPNLRIVLKELPVLGPASTEAARVAVAVRLQDAQGEKYLAFHRKLLTDRGSADKMRALAVARALGLDMARLERDLASDEIRATLEESAQLARALGISGTPAYVIGNAVVPGAIGAARLRDVIKAARK